MSEIDFISPLYNDTHDGQQLINAISSVVSSNAGIIARAIPFSSDAEIKDLIKNIEGKSRKISIIRQSGDICLFELSQTDGIKHSIQIDPGKFFIYSLPEYPNIHVVLTIEGSSFFHKLLLPSIRSLYPHASMTFITHKKLKKLIEKFQIENDYNIKITRASIRERHIENGTSKRIIPSVTWPGLELEEAFQRVYQNNGWFQSLEFEASNQGKYKYKVSFTRQGMIYTDGNFYKVYNNFVVPVAKVLYENNTFFSKRSRKESVDLSTKPLLVNFGLGQFEDPYDNQRFIQALKRMKTASVSVLHGNPYIHLSIIDFIDGSTYDLWVLNNEDAVIVPQFTGTVQSIKRLINHIFDTYAEGEIKEYKECAA